MNDLFEPARRTIPAIGLHQPYASLIAIKAKPFETRHWAPAPRYIGQRIAIHAAKHCEVDLTQDEADDITEAFGFCNWNHRLPRGAVVCTAILAGAYKCGSHFQPVGHGDEWFAQIDETVPGSVDLPDRAIKIDNFGNYAPGRWAWLLTDVELVDPPVPGIGRQKWWKWEQQA